MPDAAPASAAPARPLPRGPHRLTRGQVAASQRGRLLAAMAETVAEHGYARTSVGQVVGRAGVSTKAFYEHFRDKEDCFLAAYDAGTRQITRAVGAAVGAAEASPLERFDRALVAYLDLLAAQPAFARTFLIEVYAAGPRALERRLEVQARFADLVAQLFGATGAERFACEALVGAVISLVTRPVAARRYEELEALRAPIVELVRRHLAA